jgi:hypothetical protein
VPRLETQGMEWRTRELLQTLARLDTARRAGLTREGFPRASAIIGRPILASCPCEVIEERVYLLPASLIHPDTEHDQHS